MHSCLAIGRSWVEAVPISRKKTLNITIKLHSFIVNPIFRKQSWKEAVYWYSRVANMNDQDESGQFDGCMDDPKYQIIARQAEMYLQGGFDLEKDVNRAGIYISSVFLYPVNCFIDVKKYFYMI